MHPEMAFKSGVSLAIIFVISILWVIMFEAIGEYNGTSVETIGMIMVSICVALASAVMLYSLYATLKLKSLKA